jgi:hypothetical protein
VLLRGVQRLTRESETDSASASGDAQCPQQRTVTMHSVHNLHVDFGQGFTNAWSSFVNFIPKFIGFLVVLVIAWFVARIIARVLNTILERVGFDRLGDRSGANAVLARGNLTVTKLFVRLVYYIVLIMGLQLALGVFGPNPFSSMISAIVGWLPKLLVGVLLVIVAAAIAKAVRNVISSALSTLSYGRLLANIAAVFIIGLGVIAALNQIEVASSITTPVLTAVLAIIVGVTVVGVGGGLIMPMRSRWESWLSAAERDVQHAKAGLSAYQQGRADALANQPWQAPPVTASGQGGMGTMDRPQGGMGGPQGGMSGMGGPQGGMRPQGGMGGPTGPQGGMP